jgi:hypothetical protein
MKCCPMRQSSCPPLSYSDIYANFQEPMCEYIVSLSHSKLLYAREHFCIDSIPRSIQACWTTGISLFG